MSHSGDCKQRRVDRKIKRLKAEMAEISKQQKGIRQGQKEIRERFEKIESECEQLKRETEAVSQASDSNQLRLDIMLRILKARQENDFAKAADLTCSLRLLVKFHVDGFFFFYDFRKLCFPEGEPETSCCYGRRRLLCYTFRIDFSSLYLWTSEQ
ncbi:Peroxisomal 2,4-dienoyl-CoA reductase [Salix suchowensis]|nr:Peroxisomal 2,4-dienoyl-CoA reductase [Salix suchowensis]